MSTFFLFRKFNYVILLLFLLMPFQQNSFSQGFLLDPTTHPKFVNPLPIPGQIDATNGGKFNMHMAQTQQWLGLVDGNGVPLMTTVWGYGLKKNTVTYPGPTFFASKDVPVYVTWFNDLPGHFLPVDPSLHMAHPELPNDLSDRTDKINWIRDWYAAGNVPTVAHLHGGHTESASDGLPEAWFTQHSKDVGRYFVKTNYVYDNSQEAATLWYHDHALGITRLNVYAGLAGFYLLEDNHERMLTMGRNPILPKGPNDIEIVIQDRDFYDNGQLFWPAFPNDPENSIWNPYEDFIEGESGPLPDSDFPGGGPTALAEFFGDFIVVNGTVWPYLDVEARKYRFRLLNGSDSRFYVLKLFEIDGNGDPDGDPIPFMQIATDDGLLPEAVGIGPDYSVDALVIAPGERAEIVVDFSDFEGSSLRFLNFGPDSPFGGLPVPEEEQANPITTGQIMQFNVNLKLNRGLPNAIVEVGTSLRDALPNTQNIDRDSTRYLGLFEGRDEYNRLQPMLGAMRPTKTSIESLTWDEPITETPALNSYEEWWVYNFTGDAHPVHLHLVAFQILDREEILDFTQVEKSQPQHSGIDGKGGTVEFSSITLSDNPKNPADNEKGWKDTFIVPPGYVGRVLAKFDRPGRYVWHCHILSHEDHEMMRPYEVIANAPKQTGDIVSNVTEFKLNQNYPNPFNPSTIINFSIPTENTLISLKIYNAIGQEVSTLINQVVPAGNHEVQFDATGLPSGVYFYTLTAGNFVNSKKMIVLK